MIHTKEIKTKHIKYREEYTIEPNTVAVEYFNKSYSHKWSVEIPSSGYRVYGGRLHRRTYTTIEHAKNAIDKEIRYCTA